MYGFGEMADAKDIELAPDRLYRLLSPPFSLQPVPVMYNGYTGKNSLINGFSGLHGLALSPYKHRHRNALQATAAMRLLKKAKTHRLRRQICAGPGRPGSGNAVRHDHRMARSQRLSRCLSGLWTLKWPVGVVMTLALLLVAALMFLVYALNGGTWKGQPLPKARTRVKGSRYYVPEFRADFDGWQPKWNAAHRRYVDHDHLEWQQRFQEAEDDLPGRGSAEE